MDHSITTLFVVPDANTLPTTGSTENLTAGQFGIFKDKLRAAATAANIGTAEYIQIAQGRPGTGLGTKLSDRIKVSKLKRFTKIAGSSATQNPIIEITNFSANKGDDLIVSWRVFTPLLEARHPNGLTQSVVVPGDCVTCGDAPCTTVANEPIIDAVMAQYNLILSKQSTAGNAVRLDSYVTLAKSGTGSTAKIVITAKSPEEIAVYAPDVATRNIDKVRVVLKAWAYKAPETTADFYDPNDCNQVATVTTTQEGTFKRLTSEEIKQMEVDFHSFQATHKHVYRDGRFNDQFKSYVKDGAVYDLYFIQFDELTPDTDNFSAKFTLDETAVIAVIQGQGATIETILTTYLGAVKDARA